jgi:hypothetical protein
MVEEIYVNGESVSFGYGLDPSLWKAFNESSRIIEGDRFGAIISRHFGVKESNDARRASSNDSIVRRTVNYLASPSIGVKRLAVIGLSSPFRSEIRYDGNYIRMFFGRDSQEGFDYCNRFFFETDLSDNHYRAKEYLRLCNLLTIHSYDDDYLAERFLQQVILLQSFFKSVPISYLLIPILDLGLSRSALYAHSELIDAIDTMHYLRLNDALNGWSLVGECERRGYKMHEHHPMQDGHSYIAEEIIRAIEDQKLAV